MVIMTIITNCAKEVTAGKCIKKNVKYLFLRTVFVQCPDYLNRSFVTFLVFYHVRC
jgi:hypothetical protein